MNPKYNFNFNDRIFTFAFRPDEDDLDEFRIESSVAGGGEWKLSDSTPFVGTHCLECKARPDSETDSYVFSRGFNLLKGRQYDVVIYFRGGGNSLTEPMPMNGIEGVRPRNNAKLELLLCNGQSIEAESKSLLELGVTNEHFQYLRTQFTVDFDGAYFFAGRAKLNPGTATIALGKNLLAISAVPVEGGPGVRGLAADRRLEDFL